MLSSAEHFLQTFLESVSPRKGLGYLLQRHATGAYFPVFCMLDRDPVLFPQAFVPYAMNPAVHLGPHILGRETGLLELAARARLEVLFLEPPVKQMVFAADAAELHPPVLLVASIPQNDEFTIRGRADDFAAAAGKFMHVWNELDHRLLAGSFEACSNLQSIADAFCARVGGERSGPDPPPFLSLHAVFERSGERIERQVSDALTMNCLYAVNPSAVRLGLECAFERRLHWDARGRLQIRAYTASPDVPATMPPLEASADWHLLRAGIHALRGDRFGKDAMMTQLDYIGENGGNRTILAKPGPTPLPLDTWGGTRGTLASSHHGCSIEFVTHDAAANQIVRRQFAPVVKGIGERIQLFDPLVLAQERWDRHAAAADSLMSEPRGAHDVRELGAIAKWRIRLPLAHDNIVTLTGTALSDIASALAAGREWSFEELDRRTPETHLSLHLLWCIRKYLVHPAMLLWIAGEAVSGMPKRMLTQVFRSKRDFELDGNQKREFAVSLLAATYGLANTGGLRRFALSEGNREICVEGEVEVQDPERWLSATMLTLPAELGGGHVTKEAFVFFRAHATQIDSRLVTQPSGVVGRFSLRFPAGEIQ